MKLFEAISQICSGMIEAAEKEGIIITLKKEDIVNKKTGRAIRTDNIFDDGWEAYREPRWYDVLTDSTTPMLCVVLDNKQVEFVLAVSFSEEESLIKVLGKTQSDDRYFAPETLALATLADVEPYISTAVPVKGKKKAPETPVVKDFQEAVKEKTVLVAETVVVLEDSGEDETARNITARNIDEQLPLEESKEVSGALALVSQEEQAEKELVANNKTSRASSVKMALKAELGDMKAKDGKAKKVIDEVSKVQTDDITVVIDENTEKTISSKEEIVLIPVNNEIEEDVVEAKNKAAIVSIMTEEPLVISEEKVAAAKLNFAKIGIRGEEKWNRFLAYCGRENKDPYSFDFEGWEGKEQALRVIREFLNAA